MRELHEVGPVEIECGLYELGRSGQDGTLDIGTQIYYANYTSRFSLNRSQRYRQQSRTSTQGARRSRIGSEPLRKLQSWELFCQKVSIRRCLCPRNRCPTSPSLVEYRTAHVVLGLTLTVDLCFRSLLVGKPAPDHRSLVIRLPF